IGQSVSQTSATEVEESGDFEKFFSDFKNAVDKQISADKKAPEQSDSDRLVEIPEDDEPIACVAPIALIMSEEDKPVADNNIADLQSVYDKLIRFIANNDPEQIEIISRDEDGFLAKLSAILQNMTGQIRVKENTQGMMLPINQSVADNISDSEKPKTILDMLAEVIAQKQAEKAEKDLEKNILSKIAHSDEGKETSETSANSLNKIETTDKAAVSAANEIITTVFTDGDESLFQSGDINLINADSEINETLPVNSSADVAVQRDTSVSAENSQKSTILPTKPIIETEVKAAVANNTAKAEMVVDNAKQSNIDTVKTDTAKVANTIDHEVILEETSNKARQNLVAEKSSLVSEKVSLTKPTSETKIEGVEVKESLRGEAAEKVSASQKNTADAFSDDGESFLGNSSKDSGKTLLQTAVSDKESTFNVLMKETAETGKPEPKYTGDTSKAYDLKEPKDINRLVKTMESAAGKGESKLTVTLRPDHLGRLEIRLAENGGKITAKFFTDNETSYKMMVAQGEAIRAQLSDKGIVIDNMEFAFTDTTSRQGAGEGRKANKHAANKKDFKENQDDDEIGNEIATTKQTGIYA
ncbi:MAG: flagellar hook-length control protein FliK, partial [Deferribacterales bacterium]|nr:flagellar hook-length control protein FliK [Deferribacterales bacterium]